MIERIGKPGYSNTKLKGVYDVAFESSSLSLNNYLIDDAGRGVFNIPSVFDAQYFGKISFALISYSYRIEADVDVSRNNFIIKSQYSEGNYTDENNIINDNCDSVQIGGGGGKYMGKNLAPARVEFYFENGEGFIPVACSSLLRCRFFVQISDDVPVTFNLDLSNIKSFNKK